MASTIKSYNILCNITYNFFVEQFPDLLASTINMQKLYRDSRAGEK